MSKDIDSVIKSYLDKGHDFGFSSIDELPHEETLKEKTEQLKAADESVESLRARLKAAEDLIMPLLASLLKTSDQQYIKWPNREKPLKDLIDKFIGITRV
jgi:hypothetical protein